MIKDLINIDLSDLNIRGLDVQIVKKYSVQTAPDDSFQTKNLSILLIKSGKFKMQLREATQDLSSNDMIIIPKDSFCTIIDVKEKLQLFIISFTTEFALQNCLKKELIDSFSILILKSSMKITLDEKDFMVLSLIYKLIYYISTEYKENGIENELQRIGFNLFLYELKLIYAKYVSKNLNFTWKETMVIQFLTMLTIHCKKQHSPKFYAGSMFVTTGYLNRIVKSVSGQTLKSLITIAIINEAKNLLEDPLLSITFIAADLEFTNVANFSAFFKKATFISPSEYRKNTVASYQNR